MESESSEEEESEGEEEEEEPVVETEEEKAAWGRRADGLPPEERAAILKAEVDAYWQKQKDAHAVIIPDDAEFYFTKHFDEKNGKFYYYDHVSGLTTWDKPVGDIKMFMSEEQIDRIRAATERKGAQHEGVDSGTRALVLKKMKNEREAAQRQFAALKKQEEDRRVRGIWHALA